VSDLHTHTPPPDSGARIVFDNVSRFYGEVLGVNRVKLTIPPGITSLVGPNGSGKTTLMNLLCGLISPTEGTIVVNGIPSDRPEELFRHVGYCTQVDHFPRGLTGYEFIYYFLRCHGFPDAEAVTRTTTALERLDMTAPAARPVGGYSKGMRQRIRLAQAISHDPDVLILDEPLNGLDPMARAETIALFKAWGAAGKYVIVSSHILHEVDQLSDQVILLSHGYVVAEGQIQGVRSEVSDQPVQILVRCNQPGVLAARLFERGQVVEGKLQKDGRTLLVRTLDADRFYLLLNSVVLESGLEVDTVAPHDEDVNSVYQYLIGEGAAT
jgi:ABC-2 type transport system ATP-binding protein